MLQVKDLKVENGSVGGLIIENLDLEMFPGEISLLLGPNGVGKSTFAKALLNWPQYIISGKVSLDDEDISGLPMEERAKKGLFLAHQSPVEVPGVHLVEFIRTAYNSMRPQEGQMDPWSFKDMFEAASGSLGLSTDFSTRNLNEGFSGGEKKKNEVLQMILLQPRYVVLDEIDSGLDIDSLKTVFKAINEFASETGASILIISHNPKILEYVKPVKVHLMRDKKIIKTGDMELAKKIIEEGYATYE